MTFYINPPKGEILLDKLLQFGINRLKFLFDVSVTDGDNLEKLIERNDSVGRSDCLIDGTVKDKISHFLLRIVATQDRKIQAFFIRNETLLFSLRMKYHGLESTRTILHKASKDCAALLSGGTPVCESYKQSLLTIVSVKEQVEAILKDDKMIPEIRVPFLHALLHVEKRLSPVQQGFVIVPVNQILSLLTTLFELTLTEGFHQHQSPVPEDSSEDPRIDYLRQEIWSLFKKMVPSSRRQIFSCDIGSLLDLDKASENFPLCMKHLYCTLRKRHRLKHNARVQYILFLKEIGVPYEVVIKYFEKEYSKPPDFSECIGTCSHSWQKDNNKYIYNIQHLYGKRGSCTNYTAHKCSTLQFCREVSSGEGGCPFACFDQNYLRDTLILSGTQECDIEDIIKLATDEKYILACSSYMSSTVERRRNSNCNSTVEPRIRKFELLHQSKTAVPTIFIDTKSQKPCFQILSNYLKKKSNQMGNCTVEADTSDDISSSSSVDHLIFFSI